MITCPCRFRAVAFTLLVALVLLLGVAASAWASAYQAKLPEGLATEPDLCALVDCRAVFPGARSFSMRKGQPPYVEAYANDDRTGLLGYVMLSTDITDLPAYSGLPVVTLIGMDLAGRYVGIQVLKHSEPILLLGIPESALVQFHEQYLGKSVTDRLEVGRPARGDTDAVYVDAISGATVTVVAQNQVITASAQAVARQVGILPPTQREPARFRLSGDRPDWAQLVDEGSVQRLRVLPPQIGLPVSDEPFIELWFGSLDHPEIGRSLLGDQVWANLRARMKEGEHAIFIIRTAGTESFKGSGFVRGGIYDRILVMQGRDTFAFRDVDYFNLFGLHAVGAPAFTESAIFLIRSSAFSPAHPFKLGFLGNRVNRATGLRSFVRFEQPYWLAAHRLEGGRPVIEDDTSAVWQRIWLARQGEIVAFVLLLVGTAVVYANRERLTRRSTFTNKWPVNAFKFSAWTASVFFVGFYLMAQPSVTQVLTWFHALLFHWNWELFLSDPFIFLFWIFIIVTTFVWGRGLFCGWLCPFGSLQEGVFKIAQALGLRRWQFKLPQRWHDRGKWIKYGVFFTLFGVSLFSMTTAEVLAEVEPFKTTFLVGVLNRAWPYGLFVAVLLGLSILIERPFCKYLCPLGAALAMPSTFRWFGLKRKAECLSCQACARGCGAQAIDTKGRIDHRECLHCLDCMVLYTDAKSCPPLSQERKRRAREGLALTPIGPHGYYIPIVAHPGGARPVPSPADDPRHATAPVAPPHLARERTPGWLFAEVRHHLFPWSAAGWKSHRIIYFTGIGVALAVTWAWAWAWQGRLGADAIIGWWIGWSAYEVLVRMHGLAFVKEGPWWRTRYRQASWMDMISYVGFKNLLIGALLFLVLKSLGRLVL